MIWGDDYHLFETICQKYLLFDSSVRNEQLTYAQAINIHHGEKTSIILMKKLCIKRHSKESENQKNSEQENKFLAYSFALYIYVIMGPSEIIYQGRYHMIYIIPL